MSDTAAGFGSAHTVLRGLAALAFKSFWHRVEVYTTEEDVLPEDRVPEEGTPMIVVANHWNSAADVAVLSIWFPHYRKLHYWAKSTLFAPGLPRYLLLNAGNIPVDRKTKDNQKLFATTFDALKAGEAIAVFPEGGSETVPSLPALKDGASWAALEYAKNIRDPQSRRSLSDGGMSNVEPKDVVICVAGIAYSDKTKYRSCAVMEFGANISVEPYVDEFLRDPKPAVKKLTQRIREEMEKVTVNAPDWESRHAATMARKILFPDDRKLPLRNLREIDQSLIDLFAFSSPSPSLRRLKRLLNTYRDTLNTTALTHLSLSSLPLPDTLDPSVPHPTPTRMRVFGSLLLSTLACLIRLPFFLLPLLVHLPVYLFARYASSTALEEDQAQNKVAVGLVFALGTYATFFAVSCALLWASVPYGGALLVALAGTVVFAIYHTRLVDDNYRKFQRLLALWTVLIGLWSPIAHSEASQFLHSVHPRLSFTSPRNSSSSANAHPYTSDVPYTDAETDDETGALLAWEQSRSSTGGASYRRNGEEDEDEEANHRAPLPSPALFSEQDRMLGNFPASSFHHHAHAHSASSSSQPQSGSSSRNSSHHRRPSRHIIPISSPALGENADDPAAVELTPRGSSSPGRSPSRSEHNEGRRTGRALYSRAREVRALLRLRVETVAALRELLFGSLSSEEDGDGEDDSDLQAVLDLSARAAEEHQAGPLEVREAEGEARRRAREVGERLRGWGWKGDGLGRAKLT